MGSRNNDPARERERDFLFQIERVTVRASLLETMTLGFLVRMVKLYSPLEFVAQDSVIKSNDSLSQRIVCKCVCVCARARAHAYVLEGVCTWPEADISVFLNYFSPYF